MSTRLLFVRHAQTTWGLEHRYTGDHEVQLAPEAVAQIDWLTQKLLREPIQTIYSSPLSRCQLTIQPLAHALGLPIQTDPRLIERNLGEWEGKTSIQLPPQHPGYHFPESAYNGDFRVEQAEPLDSLEKRLHLFMIEVSEDHPGEMIVVSTHGGIIWLLQKRLVQNPPSEIHWPGNCAIIHLHQQESGFHLDRIEPGL